MSTSYTHKEHQVTAIREEHLYHGAVLNQIADHRQFTAINALKVKGKTSRCAFKVNDDIAVYIKYAVKPTGTYREYVFTFTTPNLRELADTDKAGNNLHLALVCAKDKEICCFPYEQLVKLIELRKQESGGPEAQYTLLVTLKHNEAFRVYMMQPGRRKIYLADPLKIRRNACPNALFR